MSGRRTNPTPGERIEMLIEQLRSVSDPLVRQNTEEIIELLTEMYGAALGRICQILDQDESSRKILEALCQDNLIASLLILHRLHPQDVGTRIAHALEQVAPHLDLPEGDVKLVTVKDSIAYLSIEGAREPASSSSLTLRTQLKQAIEDFAPEIDAIEVAGLNMPECTDFDSRELHVSAKEQPVSQAWRSSKRCEFCSGSVPENHQHVAAVETRKLLCACRACSFLFGGQGVAPTKFRTVPRRYLFLAEPVVTTMQWDQLEIPVGLAFFFFNSNLHRTVACYPGPAGATESLLPLVSWDKILGAHPILETLLADVEALLVDNLNQRKSPGCYIVPIDACYELVARLRPCWKGFNGGDAAHRELDRFLAELRLRSEALDR
jgi:Fe-S cluster biogenesis protein NfuA